MIDDIKNELSLNQNIEWGSVRSKNYGMLHNYATVVTTEKSLWVPGSGHDEDLDSYI